MVLEFATRYTLFKLMLPLTYKELEKSLGKVSDQIVESTHSALNKRLEASKYWIKDVESKMHGQKLFCGIVHFN